MLGRHSQILVGISGGPDSVALWNVLRELAPELGLQLVAAHLNHGLRGEESDADEAWARRHVEKSGGAFFSKLVDTQAEARARKLGIEETARALRYEFFEEAARAANFSTVATGHTLDDQAETVLMRLVRGAGIEGLGGIPPVGERAGLRLIRPLIEVTRAEILQYLEQRKIDYRNDSSNADPKYTRNFVRHELLPRIAQEWNPAVKEILARCAQQHRDATSFIDAEAENWWNRAARIQPRKILLKWEVLKKAVPFMRQELVKRALRRLAPSSSERFTFEHLVETARLFTHPHKKKVDLPDGVRARLEEKNLVISIVDEN